MRWRITQAILTPVGTVALTLLALWPVWRWYGNRLLDSSDEHWGVLALVTALAFTLHRRHRSPIGTITLNYFRLSLGLLIYVLTFPFLPPMLRALLGMGVLGLLMAHFSETRRLSWGAWGLLFLSLPIMASMQFFVGFPLRWIAGALAAALLQMAGLVVSHQGTALVWSGGVVAIDAPCSGIKMLWTALYLACVFACGYRLIWWRFVSLLSGAVAPVAKSSTKIW